MSGFFSFATSSTDVKIPMEQEDLATLSLADFCRELLADLYQDLPFERVTLDELLEGRSGVPKKAPYDPGFHANYMTGWIMKEARKTYRAHFKFKHLDLNRFLILPTDVLHGIFECLHPVDLYHLIQTTKTFRGIILNRTYRGVWTNAFREHIELPSCPRDVSEPKWASLLFGPDTCDICGNHGALADFAFRKRLCNTCMEIHLVYRRDMLDIIPNDAEDKLFIVWSLVPRTFRHSSTKYFVHGAAGLLEGLYSRHLKRDVEAMVDKVKEFLANIDIGVPGAVEKYQVFISETSAKRDGSAVDAERAIEWAQAIYHDVYSELDRVQRALAERCMTRLVHIGHDPRDTAAAERYVFYSLFQGKGITRLTCKAYRKIKPAIESIVCSKKMKRLVWERKDVVKSYYTEYRKTLKPERWAYLMPLQEVFKDTLYKNFISSEAGVIGEISKEDALARFPQLDTEFAGFQVIHLASLLPEETEHTMDPYARLNLATSVFSCKICLDSQICGVALCGWTNIVPHMSNNCPTNGYPRVSHLKLLFNSVGNVAASLLVRCLGLDPKTTTTEQLDLIDARFFCGTCPMLSVRGVRGRKVYTWTECITHATTHSIYSWQLLTPEATQFVKEHEPLYPAPESSAWGCNHCSEHFEDSVSLPRARSHVQETHGVQRPVVGKDVIAYKHQFNFPRGYSSRRPFHYALEPPQQFICKMCSKRPIYQLWSMQDLVPHLWRKHQVTGPLEHEHWEKIEIVVTT